MIATLFQPGPAPGARLRGRGRFEPACFETRRAAEPVGVLVEQW